MNCFTGAMKKKAPKTVAQQIQNLENKILTNIRDAKNTSLFDFPHVQVILRSSTSAIITHATAKETKFNF